MDFERLVQGIVEKTGCESEFVGDERLPEYKLTFRVEEERKQEINIYPFEEEGKGFVRMLTYIGKKSDFSDKKLISFLDLNMSLRFGAFAVFEGHVVLENSAMYDSIVDEDRVISQMKYLVKMADSFEKTLIGLDRK